MTLPDLEKAALRGEPSYVWREGQQRRLEMIIRAGGPRLKQRVLEDGCGIGTYIERLTPLGGKVVGLEYDLDRAKEAARRSRAIVNAESEHLPFANSTFALLLSHEVIEHVMDDRVAMLEMVRVLKPGGRAVIFCPNRGYPFETHGVYWRGKYHFGNIPLVNYLPSSWRNRLAPHVRVYSPRDLERLLLGSKVRIIERTVIFGGYDNIVQRFGALGRALRAVLQFLEKTPLRSLGLSNFWVVEKIQGDEDVRHTITG